MDPLPLAEDIGNLRFQHPGSQDQRMELGRDSIGLVALKLHQTAAFQYLGAGL